MHYASARGNIRAISVLIENGADIKLYIMNWAELINENRKRLSYLSESLNVKEEDVNEKFLREYPELVDEKSRNRLNKRELR